jgi:hypothetical protein
MSRLLLESFLDRNTAPKKDLSTQDKEYHIPCRHRWSKTYSISPFILAYVQPHPDCEISIYSKGRRASREMLLLIYRMIMGETFRMNFHS